MKCLILPLIFAIASCAGICQAQLVPDRTTLNTIIPVQTLEDFETLSIPFGGQRADSGPLNSTTFFNGDGPGLVQPGITYNSSAFFWNGNGYYALNTQTLGDSLPFRPIEGVFDSPVRAFGFDMQTYQGYSGNGTVDVYDATNQLISSTSVNLGFFGWQNAAGISRFVVTTPGDPSYIMIDNVAFGVVPEPTSLTLGAFMLGCAVVHGTVRHRKKT